MEYGEIKSAVIYRLEQRVENASGRGLLLEKYAVATAPETAPVEFGRQVHQEALRRGLARAQVVYLVMDGAVWLWDLAEDRFKDAVKTLDFHHAREHLHAVAESLHGPGTPQSKEWLKGILHRLRHGKETRVVRRLEQLLESQGQRSVEHQEIIAREVNYFQEHEDHLHYSTQGGRRRSHGQRCRRIPRQATPAAAARVRTVLGPAGINLPAPLERPGQKPRPSPPLELIPTANFGMGGESRRIKKLDIVPAENKVNLYQQQK